MNSSDTSLSAVPTGAHLIGGDWSTHAPGGTAVSDNPARPDEPVGQYPLGDASTAADAVSAAVDAQAAWTALGFGARARILEQAAVLFDARADDLALVATLEEGKTLPEARGEAVLSAETCRYQAGLAKTSTERIFPSGTPGETIRTVRSPLGVVGVITPWNFPILIPVWKIAPALATGNPVVWKPASNTPLTAVAIAAVFHDAGVPPGVLNLVLGPGSMGGALVADERVDGVTFTGSVGVGHGIRDVVTARNGRVQLELGGHNPCIVFPDADLDMAVAAVVGGAMGATGQKCTATRRIIAVGDIHDELAQSNEGVSGIDTCVYWSPILASCVATLADHFGKVHISSVVGNHGRQTHKPRMKGRVRDNLDFLLATMTANQLAADERITWDIPDTADCLVEVYDTRILLTHGDQIRGGGGGVGGLMAPVLRMIQKKRVNASFDVMAFGHFHQQILAPDQGVFACGSAKGVDEFSRLFNFPDCDPLQAFAVVTPTRGFTFTAPIFVGDQKKEGW